MSYRKSWKKTYRKPYKKTSRKYRRPNTAEQGRTMTFTITKSIPLSAMYNRPIAFPLTIPAIVACGNGQY